MIYNEELSIAVHNELWWSTEYSYTQWFIIVKCQVQLYTIYSEALSIAVHNDFEVLSIAVHSYLL